MEKICFGKITLHVRWTGERSCDCRSEWSRQAVTSNSEYLRVSLSDLKPSEVNVPLCTVPLTDVCRVTKSNSASAFPFLIWFMCQQLCWLVPRGQRLGTESFHGFWWRTTKAYLSTDRSQNKACLHHLERKEWPYCFSTDSPRIWLMNTVCCPQTQVSLNKIKSISVLCRYYQT